MYLSRIICNCSLNERTCISLILQSACKHLPSNTIKAFQQVQMVIVCSKLSDNWDMWQQHSPLYKALVVFKSILNIHKYTSSVKYNYWGDKCKRTWVNTSMWVYLYLLYLSISTNVLGPNPGLTFRADSGYIRVITEVIMWQKWIYSRLSMLYFVPIETLF